MAAGPVAVIRVARWPGGLAAGLVLALTLGTLAAVLWRAGFALRLGPADLSAIRFTIWQALLSAALSVGFAVPVARALARRRFAGRGALVTLLGAPFILPVVVAVMGLLGVFGRGGVLNDALGLVGLGPVSIYGWHGVVLAHVFFNLPLATRLILQGWQAIPAERFRLAASLGAPTGRLLEWPMLRAVAPGAFAVIFLICLTSFAVALILGGGPRATTVELAIYQAVRFEFDLGRAATLAAVQFGLCAAAAVAVRAAGGAPEAMGGGLDRVVERHEGGGWSRAADAAWIALAALFLLAPLAMVVARGLPGLVELPDGLWAAAGRSVAVALGATALTLVLALALVLRGGVAAQLSSLLPLAASSLVMGTGLFVVLYPFVAPRDVALVVTALVNAAMALPFAARVLAPAVAQAEAAHGRLADSLGLHGWARLRWLILPRIRRPLGFAAGLTAALSMGDLGVIALFAGDGQATLPLLMVRLMGAYRMEQAAGAALVLLALSLALFWVFDRGGRVDAAA
ncbi:thiamine/thiamine pyrophosphate ABC transporter permease ThiP [Limimaricola pyoseonensis]|uniref:Thiamine transport system permease protein n=1 Tax=Limimaricola pyoseonensis TaxID=521013 RepID=A0A1G7EXF5_9RHOB|nr:thiamine/thiamine pyrophosphate ABC transporter permease ThiP [Limimaricola pyoseonensis]SDE68065.1 thiamine transport system permease protein [Limimaricola pyoseonensis]